MAIHTFSTRDEARPKDEELVQRIKLIAKEDYNVPNFSTIMLEALTLWEADYESKNNSTARS